MKDLQLGRLINVVAVGSLMVTTTGCGPTARSASRKMCKAMRSCDKEAFEDEYDNLADCIETQEEYFEYFEDYSKECGKAAVEVYTCASKVIKNSCDDEDAYEEIASECLSETLDFLEECGYSDYDYDYDY